MSTLISNATDINNSDIDFCDDGQGGVYVAYSWGNQQVSSLLSLYSACTVRPPSG